MPLKGCRFAELLCGKLTKKSAVRCPARLHGWHPCDFHEGAVAVVVYRRGGG